MFDKLEYDITSPGRLVDRYSDLAQVFSNISEEDTVKHLDERDQVLKFVIAFASEESPFYKEKDFDVRREKCFSALNPGRRVKEEIEEARWTFRNTMLQWFKMQHNYLLEEWMSEKMRFHELSAYLRIPINQQPDPDKALGIWNKIDLSKVRDNLSKLEMQLFRNDKKLLSAINRTVNESRLTGYAEQFATNFFDEQP